MNWSQYVLIGQYVPGASVIHKLDPRAKLLGTLWLVSIVFLANNAAAYACLVSFTVVSMGISRLPPRFLWNGMKPVLILIVFTTVLHLFFTKGGDPILEIGRLVIYENGVNQAIFIALRLIVIISLTSLMTLTTSPLALTDALEKLLSPFKRVGLPTHELALMMSIALRFVPTLLEETEKIMKAQLSRGANFETGPLWRRLRNFLPILIPLFISAFRRAEELAIAMESRGYQGGEGRTKLRQLQMTWRDGILFVVLGSLAAALFFLRDG